MAMKENIKPATGRLGVLVVGVGGAVATTMITGTLEIGRASCRERV